MEKNLRIIKVVGDQIFLTPDYFITFEQTNFPQGSFGFNPHRLIYWLVDISFDRKSKTVEANVINYNPERVDIFYKQVSKTKIEKIEFINLCWKEIEPLMSYYTMLDFAVIIPELKSQITNKSDINSFDKQPPEKMSYDDDRDDIDYDNAPIEIKFKYYFKDAIFCLGFVSVTRFIKELNKDVELKIYNDDILAEYDYIKYYFPKVFKNRKMFNVIVQLKLIGKELIEVTANSKEIESINEELIDSVKQKRSHRFTKLVVLNDINKGLYSAEELNTIIGETAVQGNGIHPSEREIVQMIIALKDVRNNSQLAYLSEHKHSANEKIYFTLKPMFGFLFFVEGARMNHFCWELLNSHATYIWSLDKTESPYQQYNRIEEIINFIRKVGRQKYKSTYRQKLIDTNILFSLIKHPNEQSNDENSFTEWKHKLKEVIL